MADMTNNTKQAATPAKAADQALPRPYVRFWARAIDGGLYLATLPLLAAVVGTGFFFYVCFLFWLAAAVGLEALLLATVGTTPGKAILGVCVSSADGKKLSFAQAWRRSYSLYVRGKGLGSLMKWPAYRKLANDARTAWDEAGNFLIKYKQLSAGRMFGGVVAPLVATMILFGSAGLRGPKAARAGSDGAQGSGWATQQAPGKSGSISVTPVKSGAPTTKPTTKAAPTIKPSTPAPGKQGTVGNKPAKQQPGKAAPRSTGRH